MSAFVANNVSQPEECYAQACGEADEWIKRGPCTGVCGCRGQAGCCDEEQETEAEPPSVHAPGAL